MEAGASRKMAASPTVSVIIPVYNRARFVQDAIRSMLHQTFSDLEVIVVDDGSTDETASVVRAIDDPRLRFVTHEVNGGIPATRNTGLDHVRGSFIAWLDSDDVSRPERIERQMRFLTDNPSVAMVGCCAGKIGRDGRPKKGARVPPLDPEDIKAWLLFRSAFQQSAIMGRADILKRYPYGLENGVCEDHDVFLRLAPEHRLANLPLVLIDRRLHENQTIRLAKDEIRERKIELLAPQLRRVGLSFTESDLERHTMLGMTNLHSVPGDFLEWADDWMNRMRQANAGTLVVDPRSLGLATSFFWALACRAAIPHLGAAKSIKAYARSGLATGLISSRGRTWLRQVLGVRLGQGRADSPHSNAQDLGSRPTSRQ